MKNTEMARAGFMHVFFVVFFAKNTCIYQGCLEDLATCCNDTCGEGLGEDVGRDAKQRRERRQRRGGRHGTLVAIRSEGDL